MLETHSKKLRPTVSLPRTVANLFEEKKMGVGVLDPQSVSQEKLQTHLKKKKWGLVSRVHANTSNPDIYWRKQLNWRAHLELCHRNHDMLESVLNWIALSNQTARKCVPMQVVKQPEHMRTLTTEEQKWSSFQTNYHLRANNSKSFVNRSKSIIRNNLGLCKHFEICLIRTWKALSWI